MKLFLILASCLSFNLANANFAGGRGQDVPPPCAQGEHLVCAPHLAGGCNNMICVPDRKRREPIESCEASTFTVIGTQRSGKVCQPGIFYPECARTSEQDALVTARKECYPGYSKRVGDLHIINSTQIEAEYTCCEQL
jgi:hypothetical protein